MSDSHHVAPNVEVRSAPLVRRYIAAATIGNALEFYDFMIYALFAIQIGHAFFPTSTAYGSLMLSLATFGAGFATRPLGGIVLGLYADRVGRRPAMLLCLTLIGCSIVTLALIPSYARIGIAAPILAVIARLVQGFSLGGEVGSNTAFLAEATNPERRGEAVSWQGASQMVALIAGNLVGLALSTSLPASALDAYGWRIAMLLGAAAVPFGLWMRTGLPETLHDQDVTMPHNAEPASEATRQSTPASDGDSRRLSRDHWRTLVLGAAILGSGTIGSYIFNYTATYAQHTLRLSAQAGFVAMLTSSVVSLLAVLVGGRMSDRYGRWPVNVWCHLAFLCGIYPVFGWIVNSPSELSLTVGLTLLSIPGSLWTGSFIAGLAEALPRGVRSSGFGTVYALSIAVFGGTTQLVVTWLIHVSGSAMAPAWYLLAAALVGQIAVMLFPETAPVVASRPVPEAAGA